MLLTSYPFSINVRFLLWILVYLFWIWLADSLQLSPTLLLLMLCITKATPCMPPYPLQVYYANLGVVIISKQQTSNIYFIRLGQKVADRARDRAGVWQFRLKLRLVWLGFNRLPHDSRYLAKSMHCSHEFLNSTATRRSPRILKTKFKIQVTDIPKKLTITGHVRQFTNL